MPKRLVQLEGRPLFDVASYARPGSSRRDRLSLAEIEQITLTVRRAPEVMVKVLTRGGQDLKAIRHHLSYLNRGGELNIETDEGERLRGEGVESDLLSDWDLELEVDRRRSRLGPREDRAPPKIVHKILFSMPPGVPPLKVLSAVRNFAREEFALQHRYAMVLHTDEPHPHVHLVLKATSERGGRLNIRKAALRKWRSEFAWHLRELGVFANATERAVRGEVGKASKDGIYRAGVRSDSTHLRERAQMVSHDASRGGGQVELGNARLVGTQVNVRRGWSVVREALIRDRQSDLAAEVEQFIERMPSPITERGRLAGTLSKKTPSLRIHEGPAH
jgi:predicted RNA-binding protein YlqC (UPF0109 family)